MSCRPPSRVNLAVALCAAALATVAADAGQPPSPRSSRAVSTKVAGTVDVITHVPQTLSATFEGSPHTLNWYLYAEGEGRPAQATHPSQNTIEIDIITAGRYTLDLDALYFHENENNLGFDYVATDSATIIARSVDAWLEAVPESVSTAQTVTLDGASSNWGAGVTPDVEWALASLDGTPITTCAGAQAQQPADVQCIVDAATLAPDTYTMTLTLTDAASPPPYNSDTAGAVLSVFEYVPVTADFSWSPAEPDPAQIVVFSLAVTPAEAESELTQVTWDFGDGSELRTITCGGWPCTGITHTFSDDGWYTVGVTAETATEIAAANHEIKIGDPAMPPMATFTASPAAPDVLDTVTFSLDSACTGSCFYDWDLGDGAGSATASPSHAYFTPATYTVSLTVSNQAGTDSASQQLVIGNCWTPPPPLPDLTCYGAQTTLTAAGGGAYLWFSGASTASQIVTQPGTYWVDVDSGGGCWGYSSLDLVLHNCGDPDGDANLDGSVNAGDLSAVISELGDGDGSAVIGSGGGDLLAPGSDCTDPAAGAPDGQITVDDLLGIVEKVFSGG